MKINKNWSVLPVVPVGAPCGRWKIDRYTVKITADGTNRYDETKATIHLRPGCDRPIIVPTPEARSIRYILNTILLAGGE